MLLENARVQAQSRGKCSAFMTLSLQIPVKMFPLRVQIWGNSLLNVCSQLSLSCLLSNMTISDGQILRLEQKHQTSASSRKKTISEGLDVNLNNLYCWLSFLSQQLISAAQDLSPLRFHTEKHWTCGWTPTETLFECMLRLFITRDADCTFSAMLYFFRLEVGLISVYVWIIELNISPEQH